MNGSILPGSLAQSLREIPRVPVNQMVAQNEDIHIRPQETGDGLTRQPHYGFVFIERSIQDDRDARSFKKCRDQSMISGIGAP